MIVNWFCKMLIILVFLFFALPACSKDKGRENEKAGIKTPVKQAEDVVRGYGKGAMDEARKAQKIGQDRTEAVDQALRNMDKR